MMRIPQEMRPIVVATEELRSRNDYETRVKAGGGGQRSHFLPRLQRESKEIQTSEMEASWKI